MKKEATDKEKELFAAINTYIKQNGYAPTIRELGAMVGNTSPHPVFKKLNKLKEKGYINYIEGKSRTITILKKGA